MKYQGDKTDVTALIAYAQSLEQENDRLREALKRIEDLVDSEAGEPLDEAIDIATKALAR